MADTVDENALWRDRNKIFVAGLPLDADDKMLAAKFESFGEMFQAKVVYDAKTQRSRGFGFVTFCSYESALDAVRAMNQKKWDKRVLNVRFLTPKNGAPAPSAPAQPLIRTIEARPEGCTTIFVGNMPYEITDEILRKVFDVCGEIKAIRFAEDITTKEFRGFGYVQFYEGQAAETAVKTLHGTVVMGRPLKVDYGARDAPEVSEMKEALQKKLKKGICHKFQQGLCDRGDACKFAHVESVDPKQATGIPVVKSSKPTGPRCINNVPEDAPVCMSFTRGACKRGDKCNFRHIVGENAEATAPTETAPTPSFVVVNNAPDDAPVCMSYRKGKCKRGDKCNFRHIDGDLPEENEDTPIPSAPVAAPEVQVKEEVEEDDEDDDTPICKSFQQGKCKRGAQCKYRHVGAPPTRTPPSTSGLAICQKFMKGQCTKGASCRFAHPGESQAVADAKTEYQKRFQSVCYNWQNSGTCARGSNCPFEHNNAYVAKDAVEHDIKAEKDVENDMEVEEETPVESPKKEKKAKKDKKKRKMAEESDEEEDAITGFGSGFFYKDHHQTMLRGQKRKQPRLPLSPEEARLALNFTDEQSLSKNEKSRRTAIRNAMKHAWSNYEKYAFGADEVGPVSGTRRQNVWGDLSVSLVDALDTLYIMDMKDEFDKARDWVAYNLDFTHLGKDGGIVSIFEVTIRELGGLLGAYALSRDPIFMQRAVEFADLTAPAFDEVSGVFFTEFNPYTKAKSMHSWTQYRGLIADLGTLQLELRYLSDITGDPQYAKRVCN
ncbi:hypothetical protein THRCLA_10509 [Thraustotheca clavata]|uniref:alpha-1,2-Mannosidase n=1 Tax=Thraustotheca clavata TaxID=74557 RepID=A0A1V9YMC3_9STRA|nr:hypothetical protein THRCLA_10509 [Thraustotheca clavata]